MTTHLMEQFSPAIDGGEYFDDRTAYLETLCSRLARHALTAAAVQQYPELTADKPLSHIDTCRAEA